MEFLILGYLVGVAIFSTGYIKLVPEEKSIIYSILMGALFPFEIVLNLLGFVYRRFGIQINYTFSILLSEEEQKQMTDDFMRRFSDELEKMEENIRKNDEE